MSYLQSETCTSTGPKLAPDNKNRNELFGVYQYPTQEAAQQQQLSASILYLLASYVEAGNVQG